jgi:tetratricopeptide (TPR) repeat protein
VADWVVSSAPTPAITPKSMKSQPQRAHRTRRRRSPWRAPDAPSRRLLLPRALISAALALLATAAPAAAAAAQEPPSSSPPRSDPARSALPQVDVSALPAPARRHVEELLRRLAAEAGRPTDGEALAGGYALLAQLYLAYDLPAAAEQAFGAALELRPGDPELLHRRGLARRDLGNAAGAAEDFRGVVAARPDTAAAWLHLGDALLALARADGAREAFLAAERLGARAAAQYGLGRAAMTAGDAAAAVEHLQAAISLQPSATVAHGDLARAYAALGDAERAARHRSRSGAGTFDDRDAVAAEIRRVRAVTSFEAVREMAASAGADFDEQRFVDFVVAELGPAPGAVDRLRSALAAVERETPAPGRAEERARLRLGAGVLLLAEGRGEGAIDELAAAVELDPGLGHARLQLAGALAQQGRYEEAIAHFDRLVADDPDDAAALTRRAASRLRLGDERRARADLDRAVAVAADAAAEAAAHVVLANLDLTQGRLEPAGEHYRLALAADPDHRDALRGRGLLLGRQGRFGEAAATLGHLASLEPNDAAIREAEASALILAGDEAAARRRLEAAVAEIPDDPRLAARLARLLAAASDRSVRDGGRAVELALALFAVEPTADTVETLAMAYAEAGDHAQAVVWQRRLLAAEGAGAADRVRRQRNLELYEAGRSCCAADPPEGRSSRPEPMNSEPMNPESTNPEPMNSEPTNRRESRR